MGIEIAIGTFGGAERPMDIDAERQLDGLHQNSAMQQFFKRPGAMAHGVFHMRVNLAKGLAAALRNENRVIAEAARSPRRKAQTAVNLAFKAFYLSMGHG